MKRHGFLFLLFALIIGGFLFGCMGPIAPSFEPPLIRQPADYSLQGTVNYVPLQPGEDPYPLFVGARWIYRNAAKYWNPQISSSGLLESEVVAVVQGDGEQCYVLRTHYSNGPDELLYIHRAKNAVVLRGHELIEAPGSQTSFSLSPGVTFLELPLREDLSWQKVFRGGVVEAYVYHEEVVAIESGEVRTLLGSHPAIFLGAWRVHYELFGSGPRFFGGPEQFLWFAAGVGVVKHVLNSVDYELAEFRLAEEVLHLEEKDAAGSFRTPNGGLCIVELRGGSPEFSYGSVWRLDSDGSSSPLQWIDTAFYNDLEEMEDGGGTHVFQFRGTAAEQTVLRFVRSDQETGLEEDSIEFTIRVE